MPTPVATRKPPHLLLLTYCYKNDAYIVDLHYALSRDMSQLGKTRTVLESVEFLSQKEALRKRFRSLPLLPFGFSGGSQTISGARGFSVNSSSPDDPHYRTLYNQVMSTAENATLAQMVQDKNIFALVVNTNKWFACPRDEECYRLGSPLSDFMLGDRAAEMDVDDTEEQEHEPEPQEMDVDDTEEQEHEQEHEPEPQEMEDVYGPEPEENVPEPPVDGSGYFLCGNVRPTKHKSSVSDKFVHLFHYVGDSVKMCGPHEPEGIFSQFRNLPGYVESNLGNVSYMRGQYKRLMCRTALSFDQEFELILARNEAQDDTISEKVRQKRIVPVQTDCDADILRCDQEKLLSFLKNKQVGPVRLAKYPTQWVTQENIYSYLNHLGLESLIAALSEVEGRGKLYAVDVASVPVMCQANMIAAALRIQGKYSVLNGDTSTPLMGPLAEGLVKPIRQRSAPCVNREEDVSTCFARFHVGRLLEQPAFRDHRFEKHPRNTSSFRFPDLKNKANLDLLVDALFGVLVNRLFDPTSLAAFALWKHKHQNGPPVNDSASTVLPMRHEARTFGDFVFNSRVSMNKQHDVVVPQAFKGGSKESKRAISRFISSYASVHCGVSSVRKYLEHLGTNGTNGGEGTDHWKQRRSDFFQVILRSLMECGSYFNICAGTSFLVHLVMADLECKWPDLCGEVTLETVHMGHGSNVGLRLCTRHMAGMETRERLRWFHEELVGILLLLSKTDLAMMGYVEIDSVLCSSFSGRLYSYIDTEHILCKVYILLTLSYPSRTISETPFCSNTFTWPLVAECNHWTDGFKEELVDIVIGAYEKKLSEDSHWREQLLQKYPAQLKYGFAADIVSTFPELVPV